jgi:hypothetical protein
MAIQDILKRSNYAYSPTEDEWLEIWISARDNCGDNPYVNQLYDFWCNRGYLSQKQMYHLIRTIYPETRNSLSDLKLSNEL